MATLGESTITKLTVDTIDTKNNNTTNLGAHLKTVLLDSIYPIGSIYIYNGVPLNTSICPISNTLGGSWTLIENRFLYAIPRADYTSSTLTGGSNNAYIVEHEHNTMGPNGTKTIETTTDGNHGHRTEIWWNNWRTDHGNTYAKDNDPKIATYSEWGTWLTADEAANAFLISKSGSHRHTITIPANSLYGTTDGAKNYNSSVTKIHKNEASTATANMPCYLCVLAWKRIA